jgi:hypothetical protein
MESMSILILSISDEAFLSELSMSSMLPPREFVLCAGGGTTTGEYNGSLLRVAHADSNSPTTMNIKLEPDFIWVF